MIGPVMIGPSSSHTGAVARIGRVARQLLGTQPEEAVITFYNSFARTYEGHGSDRAVLAGLMDMAPDDARLKESLDLARKQNLQFSFKAVLNASALHPNTIKIEMKAGDRKVRVKGVSRGGGMISIVSIDGFTCDFDARNDTLVISAEDVQGSAAFITSVIAYEDCNIGTMSISRSAKNDVARLVLELDAPLRDLTLAYLRSLSWVKEVIYLPRPAEILPPTTAEGGQ